MTFAIWLQIDRIGSHVHIKHGHIDRYSNASCRYGLPVAIKDCSGKGIGPKLVWIYFEPDLELLVCRLGGCGKWLRGYMRCCGLAWDRWLERPRKDS